MKEKNKKKLIKKSFAINKSNTTLVTILENEDGSYYFKIFTVDQNWVGLFEVTEREKNYFENEWRNEKINFITLEGMGYN